MLMLFMRNENIESLDLTRPAQEGGSGGDGGGAGGIFQNPAWLQYSVNDGLITFLSPVKVKIESFSASVNRFGSQ